MNKRMLILWRRMWSSSSRLHPMNDLDVVHGWNYFLHWRYKHYSAFLRGWYVTYKQTGCLFMTRNSLWVKQYLNRKHEKCDVKPSPWKMILKVASCLNAQIVVVSAVLLTESPGDSTSFVKHWYCNKWGRYFFDSWVCFNFHGITEWPELERTLKIIEF